jgi:hypothetical protein
MPDPAGGDTLFAVFPILFGIVALIVVAGIALTITLAVVNARRLRQQGLNPLTLQSDLAARAMRAQVLAPARTKAERLTELDDLLGTGRISAEEFQVARERILAE